MTLLIPVEKLREAQARYAQARAAKTAPAPKPARTGFVYHERSPQQWNARIRQSLHSNFGVLVEPEPEIDPGDEDESGEPRSKVSSTTLCVCGHPRKDHHITPEAHSVDGEYAYYCITSHCSVMRYENGQHFDCDCKHFRAHETDVMKFTRPRVGPYDRCANPACGHWKQDHCTKHKPGAVTRLKPGESAYKILQKADGNSYGCKHFSLIDLACQCNSTSCSATPDGKKFCECEKFISPLLRGRAKTTKPSGAPRKSRTKKTAFMTGAGELFPPAVEVTP